MRCRMATLYSTEVSVDQFTSNQADKAVWGEGNSAFYRQLA